MLAFHLRRASEAGVVSASPHRGLPDKPSFPVPEKRADFTHLNFNRARNVNQRQTLVLLKEFFTGHRTQGLLMILPRRIACNLEAAALASTCHSAGEWSTSVRPFWPRHCTSLWPSRSCLGKPGSPPLNHQPCPSTGHTRCTGCRRCRP